MFVTALPGQRWLRGHKLVVGCQGFSADLKGSVGCCRHRLSVASVDQVWSLIQFYSFHKKSRIVSNDFDL